MAKLVLSSGGNVLNHYFIEKPRLVIGRDAQSDVIIDDALVGAQHAAIITVGEDQIIDGLDGSYGTFVNGKRVSRQILRHRDVIEFGAFSLCYLNSKAAQESEFDRTMIIAALPRQSGVTASAAPSAERGAPALATRAANVRFPSGRIRRLDGSLVPPVVELDRVVSLVGTPGTALAVITRRPRGYFITHVEGTRRARLNGRPIDEESRPLRGGDVIEAADQQFEFLLDQPVMPAELPPLASAGQQTLGTRTDSITLSRFACLLPKLDEFVRRVLFRHQKRLDGSFRRGSAADLDAKVALITLPRGGHRERRRRFEQCEDTLAILFAAGRQPDPPRPCQAGEESDAAFTRNAHDCVRPDGRTLVAHIFIPTVFQADLTAFVSLALVAWLTVSFAKAAKLAFALSLLSRRVSYQICPALSQALPPMAVAAR
jgi:hypothetical protein